MIMPHHDRSGNRVPQVSIPLSPRGRRQLDELIAATGWCKRVVVEEALALLWRERCSDGGRREEAGRVNGPERHETGD